MSTGRRIATILGWSAGVCAVVYVVFVAYLYAFVDGYDSSNPDSGGSDVAFQVLFWFLFASPIIGGIIGVVRAVRGGTTRDKVVWPLIGLVLMAAAWYALAGLAIVILGVLPGLD